MKTEANHVLHFYCTLHDSIFTEDRKGRAEEGGWWRSEVWQAWNAQTARQTVQSSGACFPVWFLTLALQRGGHRWLWRPCYNENRVQHQALHAVVLGQHSRVHQGETEMIALKDVDTHTHAHGADLQWKVSKCILIKCPLFTWVEILTKHYTTFDLQHCVKWGNWSSSMKIEHTETKCLNIIWQYVWKMGVLVQVSMPQSKLIIYGINNYLVNNCVSINLIFHEKHSRTEG